MINPFQTENEELVALASGVMVENQVGDTRLKAEELGEQQFVEFSRGNLLSDDPDIFTKLKRNRIQTFSSTKQLSVQNKDGKKTSIVINRNLFARLRVIAKSRKVDLKELLSYSLGAYPLSCPQQPEALLKPPNPNSLISWKKLETQKLICVHLPTALSLYMLLQLFSVLKESGKRLESSLTPS